ncbi:hypothetical protein SAMN04515674_105129 [Pseudarcicella hirudinis]|uniref:Uncharacterized protein n=1 Tax=Pseudarcicella hirudinis TaxID=1079859 RepID=A0A1I5SP03_9BACT|nr:hypothetical protein [Pseudarcicella hirudinis]SFP72492.1 hypothetical protein SAMN04515674_105129 [Pseudarcicella hirudinis]
MHKLYESILGRSADFRVKYQFYSEDQGGRKILPNQGTRFNFWYENHNHTMKGIFMIWPEFENEEGEIILDSHVLVSASGTAKMWIINSELIPYHADKIKIGTKGYFYEGKRIAECEVIEIIGLTSNPTKTLS